MPDIAAEIVFLSDLPLYRDEKPYRFIPGKDDGIDPEDEQLSNLSFTTHSDIKIRDMRVQPQLSFGQCGFEFVKHHASAIHAFNVEGDAESYISETNSMLKDRFSAVKVHTYEVRLRKNVQFCRTEVDMNDKLLIEGPALGAHNGQSSTTGNRFSLTL
jgi:hypothetical protein